MKQAFLIVLAVGLLVGGSAAMAFAQSSQGMGGPVPSDPPDAYRTMDTSQPGWIHTGQQADLTSLVRNGNNAPLPHSLDRLQCRFTHGYEGGSVPLLSEGGRGFFEEHLRSLLFRFQAD